MYRPRVWAEIDLQAIRDNMAAVRARVGPDAKVMAVVKRGDWNRYEIRCLGPRVQLFVNGLRTVDYTEKDEAVVLSGVIGLQIHSGKPSEIRYRNIEIAELP